MRSAAEESGYIYDDLHGVVTEHLKQGRDLRAIMWALSGLAADFGTDMKLSATAICAMVRDDCRHAQADTESAFDFTIEADSGTDSKK